jgi:hypothetical protein
MELEIATKEQVIAWFETCPECKAMLNDCFEFDEKNWINEVFNEMRFGIHPKAGLIPWNLTDYLDDPEWWETVYSEIYAIEVHRFLWLCVVRRKELDGTGVPIPNGKEIEYFKHDELEAVIDAMKKEVREYRRKIENESVQWETRTWSNGKRFVYLGENVHFVEVAAPETLQEIAAVKLSDIYDSTAQVVQSAEGKLYVKATLLDEYLMEIETVDEAKIILEEFEHLWS